MPVNVFGSTSGSTENMSDLSRFVQKPYLSTKHFEKKIEGDFAMENQQKNKILLDHDGYENF